MQTVSCPICGKTISVARDANVKVRYYCPTCQTNRVAIAENILISTDDPFVTVGVSWQDPYCAKADIALLRKNFPRLGELAISAVLEEIARTKALDLGSMRRSMAIARIGSNSKWSEGACFSLNELTQKA